MVGKAVPKSLLTYMTDINIIDAFKELQTVTRINGELIKPEAENQLVALGKAVAEMQTRIEELEEMNKWQRDRLLEIEPLIPPLEELIRFKKLIYSEQNEETK